MSPLSVELRLLSDAVFFFFFSGNKCRGCSSSRAANWFPCATFNMWCASHSAKLTAMLHMAMSRHHLRLSPACLPHIGKESDQNQRSDWFWSALAAWFGLFGLCCHIVAPLKDLLVSLTWLGMEPTASRFPAPPPPGRSDGAHLAGAAPKRATRHSAALLVNPCICSTGGWNRFTETAASLLVFPAANQRRAPAVLASSHSWSAFAAQVQMNSLPVLMAAWWAVGSHLAATFVFVRPPLFISPPQKWEARGRFLASPSWTIVLRGSLALYVFFVFFLFHGRAVQLSLVLSPHRRRSHSSAHLQV